MQFNDGASGFAADDVNLVWDDTNDRLGIGTAAPTQKLQIADINPMMSLLTSSAGKQGGMLFYDNTTTDYKWYMGYNYNNAGDGNFFIRRGNDSTGGITLLPDGIGNVGIGTATPAATALLDLTSTSKGFLPPRMDTTQRNTIASPATGLMIYNTTNAGLEVYDGSAWRGVNTSVAFRAHKGGTAQAVAASTATALTFSTETFDTSNNFSTATGRFTPTVAGIYIVTGSVRCDASTTYCQAIIYKNGSGIANHYDYHTAANMAHVTTLVSMNGSTDYLQLYGVSGGAAGNINGGDSNTYFEAALVGGGSGGGGSGTAAGSVAGAVQFNDGASGFAADDVNLVWDDSNDRLGIGTASPTEKLEVTPGNIRIGGNIKLSASNPKIIADNSDTQQGTIELRDLSTGNMILTPSNGGSVQRNLIIPLGKVGIGTTSPDWPLHIRNTAAPVIQLEEVDSSGNAFIGVDGNNLFVRRGTIATADAMTITSTGNVGIGTTSPVYRLHVADTPNSGKIGYLTIGRSGGDYPSVGYNVRYGTTTSTYTYDITDTASMFRFHQGAYRRSRQRAGHPEIRSLSQRGHISPRAARLGLPHLMRG
ncbi:MAG: hypothetical protein M5U16_01430 [Hyphomicrobium sp.]|nr:hypothetical protein [Hyphomicrobium sp.]